MSPRRLAPAALLVLAASTLVGAAGAEAPEPARLAGRGTPGLRDADGGAWTVRAVRPLDPRATYNLAVADTATYYVGERGVLAHNTSPCPPVNPSGRRDNCAHCTAAAITGRTAPEIAGITGIPEGIVPVREVPELLRRSGLQLGQPRGFAQTPEGFDELGRFVRTLPGDSDVVVIFGGDEVNHVVHGRVRGGNLDLVDHQSGVSGPEVAAQNSRPGHPVMIVPVR